MTMAIARRYPCHLVLAAGITAGAVVGYLWADLMWPAVAADHYNSRHAIRALSLDVLGAIGLWWLVAWPFAWLSRADQPAPQCASEADAYRIVIRGATRSSNPEFLRVAGSIASTRPGMTSYSGAALSPFARDSFETSEATTITTAIKAITSVQIALISGFTPSRTSE